MFQDKLTKEIAAAAAQIKTEPTKNVVNGNSVEGAVVSIMANEELKGNQHKIDANKNNRIDAHDFKLLRAKKGVKEEAEQLDEIGDTPAGRKALGSYVNKAIDDKSKDRSKGLRKATSRMYKDNFYGKKTNEEVEQLDEIGDTPAGQQRLLKTFKRQNRYAGSSQAGKASVATHRKSGTGAALDYGDKVMDQASKRMSDTTKNKRSVFMSKVKNPQPHKSDRPGLLSRAAGAVKKVFSREEVESIFNEFSVDEIHMFMMSEEFEMLHVELQEQIDSYLEERTLNEGFPTVADAKKRMDAKNSPFEKKKISTGTVYSRKYKSEPDDADDMPKKKAKTMKEMLDIYKNYGAESLVENLLIEEPSQDEYKKEVEVAQAKADGKVRNDKNIAKAASQGVKMEEVEIEVLDADEINGVQIDNIEERSMTEPEMKKREEIVKSMKKGIQGFKDRYGERAKSVMYATATKNAMKD